MVRSDLMRCSGNCRAVEKYSTSREDLWNPSKYRLKQHVNLFQLTKGKFYCNPYFHWKILPNFPREFPPWKWPLLFIFTYFFSLILLLSPRRSRNSGLNLLIDFYFENNHRKPRQGKLKTCYPAKSN